jgi:hypothetical protein
MTLSPDRCRPLPLVRVVAEARDHAIVKLNRVLRVAACCKVWRIQVLIGSQHRGTLIAETVLMTVLKDRPHCVTHDHAV